ncbi:hypothetical protein HMPREF9080_00962 [Cardiobacterium valvarum F0432]|uniref:Uncharacterized protein n=1 Tax=Cardiobacterium valvarum F0432 TaxID=797473 RepID=G9ZDX8_9GAMM|nr:hypothetical protein HMPREF9080_00962 [Cardiobacterium valvarum F0432]
MGWEWHDSAPPDAWQGKGCAPGAISAVNNGRCGVYHLDWGL